MTERGYMAARALVEDPGATPEERDTARRRCAEHEAAHPASPTAAPGIAIFAFDDRGVDPWLRYFHGDRDFDRRIVGIEGGA